MTVATLAPAARATFPGANGRIVYPSGPDGLWTARSDGSYRAPLVRLPYAREPAWSADGLRVIFTASRAGTNASTEIYEVHADGTRLRRLTRNRVLEASPSWSPTGHRIAFLRASRDPRLRELWVMRADGSRRRFVTFADTVDAAEWSPTGSSVAYVAPDGDIHLVDVDTGADRRVTDEPGAALVGDLSWAPDGSWIAFTEIAGCGPCDGATSLAKVRPDGTRQQKIEPGRRFQTGSVAPHWSPDGRFVSFCRRNYQGRAPRWRTHPDGRQRKLVATVGCDGAWQPLPGR